MKNSTHQPLQKSVKFEQKLLDHNALAVIRTIHKAGFDAYLVGGCVRDLLLDLKPKDFDVVTCAKPEQVHKLFKRSRIIGRRFRLVHILFSARDFIEVATFRSGKGQTAKNGIIVKNNLYGNIQQDVIRRDFGVNALYYDIDKQQVIDYVGGLDDLSSGEIRSLGDAHLNFEQDPVRMIRAVRFAVKLNFALSAEIKQAIYQQASLLANIAAARLYEECLKLFCNQDALAVYQQLEKFGLLVHLFAQTKTDDFINQALLNTSRRIKKQQPVTIVFVFSVFLWQAWNLRLMSVKKRQKSVYLAQIEAANLVILAQIKQVSMPKWLTEKIKEVWFLQAKLEKMELNKTQKLLTHPRFRMAYDFLLLRAKSINPELSAAVKFWTDEQKNHHKGGQNGKKI